MSRLRRRRMFVVCDFPVLVALVIMLVLMLATLRAAATDAVAAVAMVATEGANGVDLLKLLSAGSNFTVAGILWYFSRLFYIANEKKDALLLELSKSNAKIAADSNHGLERSNNLAANYEDLVRELRPDLRKATGRVPAHNSG